MICRTALVATFAHMADGWRPSATESMDSAVVPVRCHWTDAREEAKCTAAIAAVEDAWVAQVDGLGFAAPMPDDDGILDLYITTQGTEGGAYATGPMIDEDREDGRMGCHAYIALDAAITVEEMPGYISHEFNHVLQYGTDFVEPTLPIWEATASAAEVWTYPDTEITDYYIADFQSTPWLGILSDGYFLWDEYEIWSYYEYGAGIWILHMDGAWGDGNGSAGPDLWWSAVQESWNNEPDVLDAYDIVTGDWRMGLVELSADRARMGGEHAPDWAAGLDRRAFKASRDGEYTLSDLPVDVDPEYQPYETGTVYADLTEVPAGTTVRISASSGDDTIWGLFAVEGTEWGGTIENEFTWTAAGSPITVGAINLGGPDFDADDTIRQSALVLTISEDGGGDDTGGGGDGGGDGGSGDGGGDAGEDGGGNNSPPGDRPTEDEDGGCGCNAGVSAAGGLVWLVGPMLIAVRRRRQST